MLLHFQKARLKSTQKKTRHFLKLSIQYYKSFRVIEKISDVVFQLELPSHWTIHISFHVSILKPFQGDVPKDLSQEMQPKVEELDEFLVLEQILNHKDRKIRRKVTKRYLVKFLNYSPLHAKWMDEDELAATPKLLELYLEAFQLEPIDVWAPTAEEVSTSRAVVDAQEGGDISAQLVEMTLRVVKEAVFAPRRSSRRLTPP